MKKNILYLFAHQDDEISIIVRMSTNVKEGNDVFAVWITDGAVSGTPDVREKESRDVMEMLGIPKENLYFLGYPDMDSYRHLPEIFSDVKKIAEEIHPAEIISNAYEGGNIDHDASNFIASQVVKALKNKTIHYEFPSYNLYKGLFRVGKFLPRKGSKTLYTLLDDERIELKLKALEMYPSQADVLNVLKTHVNPAVLKRLGEPCRITPAYDYTQRPVEGTLGYEVTPRISRKFEDWQEAVGNFFSLVH
ncbi:MAG: PIG-L family deacetylase [bacterium]